MFRWLKFLFFKPKTLEELVRGCKDPKDINQWMWNNLEFMTDLKRWGEREYWQPPLDTFMLRTGDCEDYGLLAQYVLKKNGFRTHMLVTYGTNTHDGQYKGHAVCVVWWKGTYWHISNWGLVKTPAIVLHDVRNYVYKYSSEFYRYTDMFGEPVTISRKEDKQ